MQARSMKRALFVALPLGILIGATGAYAANRYLEEADGHVDRAIDALHKANNPGEQGEYGGHRKRALDLLGDVKRQIKKAREYDERHPVKPAPPPKPDAGPVPQPTGNPGPQPKPIPSGGPVKPLPSPTGGPTKPNPGAGGGAAKPPAPNSPAQKK
jgi:hypothetical protein